MLNTNTLRRLACQLSLGVFLAATPSFAQVCTCPGDLSGDGMIDGADLGQLLGVWGSASAAADLNHDGLVDGADLGALLAVWGPCGIPINDSCANAVNITEGTHQFCTLHATDDGPSFPGASCQSGTTQMHRDIWFRFTAPSTGSLTVTTCDAADFDTIIAVYGAAAPGTAVCPSAGQGILLGCNDDDVFHCQGDTSTVVIQAEAGYIYTIRVGGFFVGEGGTGGLTVAMGAPGSSCINPVFTYPNNFGAVSLTGSTVGNTTTADFPLACSSGQPVGPTEWVRWVAPCNGTATATTCQSATDFDTVLTVLHQSPGATCWSNFVTCNDDSLVSGCDLAGHNYKSYVEFPVVANHVYYVCVSGYGSAQGTYGLLILWDCN